MRCASSSTPTPTAWSWRRSAGSAASSARAASPTATWPLHPGSRGLPDWLIAELGLEGKLAGSKKNRVKAVKLRGSLSQGLVYPVSDGMIRGRQVAAGDDVTELLELVKYEPPIPISMQGEVRAAHGATLKYDIEDFKKYPQEFRDGEPVVITEKLHGTWCCLGWHPEHGTIVTSKGMSDKGRAGVLGGQAQQAALQMHDLIVQRDRVDGRELFPQPLFDRLG